MPFTLESVVPWGRTLAEYTAMFALTDADLAGTILGCADGPAAFNADATQRGVKVISCDPLYQFSAEQIEARIHATYDTIVQGARENLDDFVWTEYGTPEGLGRARMGAMRRFLEDYDQGKRAGRYVTASLPALPFGDQSFDLALCSHFLFLYADHFSLDFHRAAVLDLCRVAREVRIFPLLPLGSRIMSSHVEPIMAALRELGCEAELVKVGYEFQKGGDTMLVIRACPDARR